MVMKLMRFIKAATEPLSPKSPQQLAHAKLAQFIATCLQVASAAEGLWSHYAG